MSSDRYSYEVLLPAKDRFWSKVEVREVDECWEWLASKNKGYGQFQSQRRPLPAHRVAYQLTFRNLDPDLVIDHLCGNPGCCNPHHMEQVSRFENVRRGSALGWRGRRTHCIRGHEFTEENTYWLRKNTRVCKKCRRMTEQNRRARHTVSATEGVQYSV